MGNIEAGLDANKPKPDEKDLSLLTNEYIAIAAVQDTATSMAETLLGYLSLSQHSISRTTEESLNSDCWLACGFTSTSTGSLLQGIKSPTPGTFGTLMKPALHCRLKPLTP